MKHTIRRIILSSIIIIPVLVMSVHPMSSQSPGEREFTGTINNNLKIRIKLSRSGDNLSGSYAYERTGGSLRLKGTITYRPEHGEYFKLKEFDERGRQTGTFEGRFVSEDWIEGLWTSTKTKKQLPFSAFAIDGNEIPAADADDVVSGYYMRVDESGRVDLDTFLGYLSVSLLEDGQLEVVGDATVIRGRDDVSFGNVEGIARLQGSKWFFKQEGSEDDASGCRLTIKFGRNSLTVIEDSGTCAGVGCHFLGKYRKLIPPWKISKGWTAVPRRTPLFLER